MTECSNHSSEDAIHTGQRRRSKDAPTGNSHAKLNVIYRTLVSSDTYTYTQMWLISKRDLAVNRLKADNVLYKTHYKEWNNVSQLHTCVGAVSGQTLRQDSHQLLRLHSLTQIGVVKWHHYDAVKRYKICTQINNAAMQALNAEYNENRSTFLAANISSGMWHWKSLSNPSRNSISLANRILGLALLTVCRNHRNQLVPTVPGWKSRRPSL